MASAPVATSEWHRGLAGAAMRGGAAPVGRRERPRGGEDAARSRHGDRSAGYRLYERGGWTRVGEIPNYALMPDGTPCPTTYFYKVVG